MNDPHSLPQAAAEGEPPRAALIREALLQRPNPPQVGLQRTRLFDLLNRNLDLSASLVCAPAGYGKSVLVSQWAETVSRPVVWLSGDQTLNDPHRFLLHLTAALRGVFPESVPVASQMAHSVELPELDAVITELSNEMARLPAPIILVLDDFHLWTSTQCQRIVSELVRRPSGSVHVVIVTRQEPPASIGGLRAKGQMDEVGMADLAFSWDELAGFTRQALDFELSSDQIDDLYRSTEGWPSGARLATQAFRLSPEQDTVLGAALLDQAAQEYLLSEVLDRVPAEVRFYLLAASLFDRFNAELCDALASVASSAPLMTGAEFIEWVWRNNLFVVHLGGAGNWFRLHHVFARLLELRGPQSPDYQLLQEPAMRRAAAKVFRRHEMMEEAIGQLSLVEDESEITSLAIEHGGKLLEQEKWLQLSQLLASIPSAAQDASPGLLMLQAWLVGDVQSRHTQMSELLSRAEGLLAQHEWGEATKASLLGQIACLRSAYERFIFGDFEGALAEATTARRLLSGIPGRHLTFAYVVETLALAGLGRSLEAHRLAKAVVEDERFAEARFHPMAWAMPYLGWLEGDLTDLERHATQLLAIGERYEMPDTVASAHYFLGIAEYERNQLDEAEGHLREVIELRFATQSINAVHSYIALALVALARGQRAKADEVAQSMMKYVLETHSAFLLPVAEAFMAQLDLRLGRQASALRWAQRADPEVSRHRYMFFTLGSTIVEVFLSNEPDVGKGREMLAQYLETAERRRHHPDTLRLLAIQAIDLADRGDESQALDSLAIAVRMSHESGMVRRIADLGPALIPLLHRLQVTGDMLTHVSSILQAIEPNTSNDQPSIPGPTRSGRAGESELTDRELEVLNMLAARYSNKEIARELVIAPATVKKHTIALYDKLNVHGRREAVAKADALGYLTR